jgi:hypothetical protein
MRPIWFWMVRTISCLKFRVSTAFAPLDGKQRPPDVGVLDPLPETTLQNVS